MEEIKHLNREAQETKKGGPGKGEHNREKPPRILERA